jgi:hypothetical protein
MGKEGARIVSAREMRNNKKSGRSAFKKIQLT